MNNQEVAEFIGIMLGDGHIGIYDFFSLGKKRRLHQLKVTLDSRNTQYIYYVAGLLKKIFNLEPKIYFRKENAVDIKIYKKDKVIFAINEIGLRLSPKWNTMKIPKSYMVKKLYPYIIRGLFDTDGSVTIFNNNGTIYPRIEIRLCPCPAQKQIFSILDFLGISYRIQSLERGKIKIRISGKKELRKWFDLIGTSNKYYFKRAERFLT